MISYYYGQTGIACVIYYRRYLFKSVKNFFLVGVLPLIGGVTLGVVFLKSVMGHDGYRRTPIRRSRGSG